MIQIAEIDNYYKSTPFRRQYQNNVALNLIQHIPSHEDIKSLGNFISDTGHVVGIVACTIWHDIWNIVLFM